jgi:hypothetical protein
MVSRASSAATALFLITSITASVGAQTLTTDKQSSVARESHGNDTRAKRRDPADIAEAQQALAISKIASLADEANSFKDQVLRVRVQAQAADVLWENDQGQARMLFHRAWDAAEAVDKADALAAEEKRRAALTSRQGLTFIPPPSNLRFEVLSLAVRRDQKLGERLLSRLEDAAAQEAESKSSNNQPNFFDPTEPPQAIAKRLELATELLKTKEVSRAKSIADPGLKYTTSQGIIFLSTLRQLDSEAADARYARLLEVTAKDQRTDATTISLLSSYIFTPNLLVTATRRGRVSNQWSEATLTWNPPAGLRTGFFRVAGDILLRPLPAPDQDSTSAGRGGTYFTIARLLPLFGQYAPDRVPALNARLALLAQDTPEAYRTNANGMMTAGIVPEDPAKDDLSNILSQLSNKFGTARDVIYVKAIRVAAMNGDNRIREFAEKIENIDLRKRASAFADFVAVRKALDGKDVEAAVRIVRDGELQPLQRVWAYAEAAGLLSASDVSGAAQMLDQAASEAQSIKGGEVERVHALACVASYYLKIDRMRAWDVAADVMTASDAAPDFSADGGKLVARLQARGVAAMVNFDVLSFNLTNLFELLAKDDFQRADAAAEALKGEAPRAAAKLAVARSLLGKKGN